MKVVVKLFATLRIGRGKIVEKDYEEGIKIREIIKELNIDEKDVAILLKNGISTSMDTELTEGDFISVFPPVGGG